MRGRQIHLILIISLLGTFEIENLDEKWDLKKMYLNFKFFFVDSL